MKNSTVPTTKIATVVYLITETGIYLARKKQNIHIGEEELKNTAKLNGYGGKKEERDVSVRATAIREVESEALITALGENLIPCGRFRFYWPENETNIPNMDVYFFFLKVWEGVPQESEEMSEPQLFAFDDIPYDDMLPDSKLFLKRMLLGEKLVADIYYELDEDGKQKIKKFFERNELLEV